jgi:hypothetical protein
MEEEIENLATARGILDDLNAQLGQAIAAWNQTASSQIDAGQLLSAQIPGAALPQPRAEYSTSPRSSANSVPALDNHAVGTHARYVQQWKDWTEAPTIHDPRTLDLSQPTRWWMQDKDHYGLCQPLEQHQLESSAKAAQFNRACTSTEPYHPGTHEVRQAQTHRFHPSALPLPPALDAKLSHGRRVRAGSEDFWLDDDYDPDFWQKNIQRGTLWFGPPRFPISEEAPVSPRTVPQQLRGGRTAFPHN